MTATQPMTVTRTTYAEPTTGRHLLVEVAPGHRLELFLGRRSVMAKVTGPAGAEYDATADRTALGLARKLFAGKRTPAEPLFDWCCENLHGPLVAALQAALSAR